MFQLDLLFSPFHVHIKTQNIASSIAIYWKDLFWVWHRLAKKRQNWTCNRLQGGESITFFYTWQSPGSPIPGRGTPEHNRRSWHLSNNFIPYSCPIASQSHHTLQIISSSAAKTWAPNQIVSQEEVGSLAHANMGLPPPKPPPPSRMQLHRCWQLKTLGKKKTFPTKKTENLSLYLSQDSMQNRETSCQRSITTEIPTTQNTSPKWTCSCYPTTHPHHCISKTPNWKQEEEQQKQHMSWDNRKLPKTKAKTTTTQHSTPNILGRPDQARNTSWKQTPHKRKNLLHFES